MKIHENRLWLGLTVFLLIFGTVVTSTPHLLAEQKYSEYEAREYINRFQFVFQQVLEKYVDEIHPKDLFKGAVEGLFNSLDDPYSYYLTADDLTSLSDTTTGRFGGVGLYIAKPAPGRELQDERDKYVRVVAPIEGTPAHRAGIQAGDFIIKIEGEPTDKWTIDEVMDRLRGVPGTKVEVTILRGKSVTLQITIERAIIEIPTVKKDMIDDDTGYLRIIQFTPYTHERVKEAIGFFKENNYTSMIIDVRGNPGGLLNSVVRISDFFLSEGPIVSTKSRIEGESREYRASPLVEIPKDMPIVTLIDKGSASASEILAGALKDTNRTYLIGENTFGKGSVQQIYPYGQWGFKMTVSRYYTPAGTNIDRVGIAPHREVKERELTEEENESLKRLIEQNYIPQFVNEYPDFSSSTKEEFIQDLLDTSIKLEKRLLRKLIRDEYNRRMDFPPVYDLEYDLALLEALEYLQSKTH